MQRVSVAIRFVPLVAIECKTGGDVISVIAGFAMRAKVQDALVVVEGPCGGMEMISDGVIRDVGCGAGE